MQNADNFIQHILNTSKDDLLLKFWQQQLERKMATNEGMGTLEPPTISETTNAELAAAMAGLLPD